VIAIVFAGGAAVIAVSGSARVLAVATTLAIVGLLYIGSTNPLVRERTFFGVIEVREANQGIARSEFSGTTLHGLQFLDSRRYEPTTYYVRSGPLGDAMTDLRKRLPDGANIGVVGLGTGTVAAYERPNDTMTFFEIDQAVIDLARDTRHFNYLADAPVPPRIVLGDARLSLAAEPSATYDLIVLDAFSSDAVPAHLLTREAMQTYLRTLRPGGIIAFHLSNRYYELVPAVATTARSTGLGAMGLSYVPNATRVDQIAARSSSWVVVGRPPDAARFKALGWSEPFVGPVLTDDFSDILRLLRFP
jgi:SAM-dependent methyltransferase